MRGVPFLTAPAPGPRPMGVGSAHGRALVRPGGTPKNCAVVDWCWLTDALSSQIARTCLEIFPVWFFPENSLGCFRLTAGRPCPGSGVVTGDPKPNQLDAQIVIVCMDYRAILVELVARAERH